MTGKRCEENVEKGEEDVKNLFRFPHRNAECEKQQAFSPGFFHILSISHIMEFLSF
jgi:hypothetical protein